MLNSRKMSETELKDDIEDPTPDFGFSEINMGDGSFPGHFVKSA